MEESSGNPFLWHQIAKAIKCAFGRVRRFPEQKDSNKQEPLGIDSFGTKLLKQLSVPSERIPRGSYIIVIHYVME